MSSSADTKYRSYISQSAKRKRVFHVRSGGELMQLLESMKEEHSRVGREAADAKETS